MIRWPHEINLSKYSWTALFRAHALCKISVFISVFFSLTSYKFLNYTYFVTTYNTFRRDQFIVQALSTKGLRFKLEVGSL